MILNGFLVQEMAAKRKKWKGSRKKKMSSFLFLGQLNFG